MQYFPLFMRGDRLRVLLVGGGVIAAAKLETLVACGADVTVVAQRLDQGVRALADRQGVRLLQQSYEACLLARCNLVVAATGDRLLGERIAADAHAAGIWVNVVDNPALCDFIFPAMIHRGPLQVAISTGGSSPVLARLLKQDFEQVLPEGVAGLLAFMEARTAEVRARLPDVQLRRLFWERVIRGPVGRLLSAGGTAEAASWFVEALQHAGGQETCHALHFVPIWSYDPDDVTVRAVRLIGKADVILYEGGGGLRPLLERYARRDGEKRPVEGEPLTQLKVALETGGIVAYLAWGQAPGYVRMRDRIFACARESGVRLEVDRPHI